MVILYPLESYVEGDCRSYMGTPEKDFRASGLKSGRGPRVFGVRMHAVIRQPKSQNEGLRMPPDALSDAQCQTKP